MLWSKIYLMYISNISNLMVAGNISTLTFNPSLINMEYFLVIVVPYTGTKWRSWAKTPSSYRYNSTLLFQAGLPTSFSLEALNFSFFFVSNLLPVHKYQSLFEQLYNKLPVFFFYLCTYPNLTTIVPRKVSPCSAACVFLGYSESYERFSVLWSLH